MMPLMLAALVAMQPTEDKLMVLPVRVPSTATTEVRGAAAGIERLLVEAMHRHTAWKVLSRNDVAAVAGKAAQDQLMGCDAEACLAEIADALGARYALLTALDVTPGIWSLQSALVDRKTATTVRRTGVKARGLDALIASLDPMARQLAAGQSVTADDPDLVRRLGTNETGANALQQRLHQHTDGDVLTDWTDVVVARNAESGVLALTTGALVGSVGLLVVMGAFLHGALLPAIFIHSVGGFAVIPVAAFILVPILTLLLVPLPLGVAAVLGLVDALNFGRVPVARNGCCRDEQRIRDASLPGWARRLAPLFGVAGALVAVTVPAAACAGLVVGIPFWIEAPLRSGPLIQGPDRAFLDVVAVPAVMMLLVSAVAALASVAGGTMLYATDPNDLVDG